MSAATTVKRFPAFLAALVCVCLAGEGARADDRPITVFAAASLRNALDAVNDAWARQGHAQAVVSYAGSSTLARQIEQGAPADVFVSANQRWMDFLEDAGLIRADTRFDLLANRIVLIAPSSSGADTVIEPGFDLLALLGDGYLAMANTEAVPAGIYGKAALQALGVWEAVRTRIAQADNVRAALRLVSSGEAPLGIVYRTDAVAEPQVRIVDVFAEDLHPPIVYPAATTAGSSGMDAGAFLAYLRSGEARSLFEAQGFSVVVPVARD